MLERAVGPIRTRETRARFLCGTRTARHGISRVPVYYARKLISAQRKVRRRPFKARAYPGPLKTYWQPPRLANVASQRPHAAIYLEESDTLNDFYEKSFGSP